MTSELYYHPKKGDYMILRRDKTGVSSTTGFTSYRSCAVIENPEFYGWRRVGWLKARRKKK